MTELAANLKKCPFCNKNVQNLGAHIANLHPKILDKLEEFGEPEGQKVPPGVVFAPNQGVKKTTSDLVREKLDLMMDIKILEMLSQSKDASLQDIKRALEPPQPAVNPIDKLRELRELNDIVKDIRGDYDTPESGGNEWLQLANNAIPLIKEMLPAKKREMREEAIKDVRERDSQSGRILKRIQSQTTGSPREPSNTERQHSSDSGTEQQNTSSITRTAN